MKQLIKDFKKFYRDCKNENFAFYMAAGYIIFSYLRPHVIFKWLDVIPWTRLFILGGLAYAITKQTVKLQAAHLAILFFAFSCCLSSYLSFEPEWSFSKLDVIFIWFLEVLFFTACVDSRHKFKLLTILFFLVLFKISFFGARTWVQRGFGFRDYGIAGPMGFFENSGELSLLMAMLAIMSLSILISQKQLSKWYYLLPLTAYMTVLAASSRGSQLALAIGTFIFFSIKGKFKIKYLLITIFVGYVGFLLLPAKQQERFTSSGEDDTSTSRLIYWAAGLDMLKEKPLTGIGFRCFPDYFHTYFQHMIPNDQSWGNKKEVAHNTLIEVSSEMGIIGFSTYMFMYFLVFKLNSSSRKHLRPYAKNINEDWLYQYSIGLDVANITYFIGAFFMSVAFYPYIYFMLMFSTVLNNIAKREALHHQYGTT